MNDKELLAKAIEQSGLGVRTFARDVLVREPRVVWRWLDGKAPMPWPVRRKCEQLTSCPPPAAQPEPKLLE